MSTERITAMEVKINYLEADIKEVKGTLKEVGDIARATKTQLLVGVGAISVLSNFIPKILAFFSGN